MEKLKPYVGVTGISHINDGKIISEAFAQYLPRDHPTHQGMAGYLVSRRTLVGELDMYDEYPEITQLPQLLTQTKDNAFNTIHYTTDNKEMLPSQIIQLFQSFNIYDTGLCRALQLNNRQFPNPIYLDQIKTRFPDLILIIPLTSWILSNFNRFDIANQLKMLDPLIDYILFDPSGGRALTFDIDPVVYTYRAVADVLPSKGIIFAGGFTDLNTTRRLDLLHERLGIKNFGIDAEGGLRYGNDFDPHSGKLSTLHATDYIKAASKFFST